MTYKKYKLKKEEREDKEKQRQTRKTLIKDILYSFSYETDNPKVGEEVVISVKDFNKIAERIIGRKNTISDNLITRKDKINMRKKIEKILNDIDKELEKNNKGYKLTNKGRATLIVNNFGE